MSERDHRVEALRAGVRMWQSNRAITMIKLTFCRLDHGSFGWLAERVKSPLGCQLVLILPAWLWSYFRFELILLELAIEGGLADAQNASGLQLVSTGFAKGGQDG